MKTTKLTIGILSIILSVFITFQSSIAGLGNALADNGEFSGSAGVILAVCYLVAGIIGIVARNGGGGGYVGGAFYLFGALLALPNAGSYADLVVWGWLAVIFGLAFIFTTYKQGNRGGAPKVKKLYNHPSNILSKELSWPWYFAIAFVVVGIADLIFNFSGLNILADFLN